MTSHPKILLVEDDEALVEVLSYALLKQGYQPIVVSNGPQCVELFQAVKPDLILLDLTLPGPDGLEVCREIRLSSAVPILILTARVAEEDHILGLEAGADDYVSKPFSMKELMLRIKNLLMRSTQSAAPLSIRTGDFIIIPEYEVVVVRGKPVHLSRKEFQLFYYLAKHTGEVFTREELIQQAWFDTADQPVTNQNVNVHIHQIREKIEQDAVRPRHLLTIRGAGYKFSFCEND
jgi:two-component system response regulator VicR